MSSLPILETLQVHKLVREITKDNVPFIKFFKLSRDNMPLVLSITDPKKILKFAGIQIRMSMTARVLIVSLIINSMTSKKNGFVAHFVKSGSMKAVFTN